MKPKKQKQAEALTRLERYHIDQIRQYNEARPEQRERMEPKIAQRQGHINYLREKFGVSAWDAARAAIARATGERK